MNPAAGASRDTETADNAGRERRTQRRAGARRERRKTIRNKHFSIAGLQRKTPPPAHHTRPTRQSGRQTANEQ